jgi:hypothetical protein
MMPHVPYWCEENIWVRCRALAAEARAGHHVVFISNAARTVACWSQRAASRPGEPVLWDYHVVLLAPAPSTGFVPPRAARVLVEDPDCLAGERLPFEAWCRATFPLGDAVLPQLRPRFRLAPVDVFLADFASDRSHMRATDGAWLVAPPPWPAPRPEGGTATHTLPRWWDTQAPDGPGLTVDLAGLVAFVAHLGTLT